MATMSTTSTPRGWARAAALLASAFVIGAIFAAVPAQANVTSDSVRITSDSVRITSDDSVRITSGCEEPDREHILCP